jgi:hypothetical protein
VPILCTVFVDGGYVREEMRRAQLADEFDPREPGHWLAEQKVIIGGRIVVPDRTVYYDAVDEAAEQVAADKMDTYLKRVAALAEVRVGNPGYLRRTAKKKREQKAVDVPTYCRRFGMGFCTQGRRYRDRVGRRRLRSVTRGEQAHWTYAIVLAFRGHLAEELIAAADRQEYLPTPTTGWLLT